MKILIIFLVKDMTCGKPTLLLENCKRQLFFSVRDREDIESMGPLSTVHLTPILLTKCESGKSRQGLAF